VPTQPSDRIGDDFSKLYKESTERLINLEDLIKASVEQLVQEMSDHDKAYLLFDSMSGDDKAILVRAVTYHSFLFPFPPSIIYSLLRFNLANPPFSI
jgi:hypothetical protein